MDNNIDWEEDYLSIYEEDYIFSLLEDDAIDIFEAGFMHGYIAG